MIIKEILACGRGRKASGVLAREKRAAPGGFREAFGAVSS